ncbi:MAG: 2-amino-4-hydroxy-6-hydroxymethyldihydropteridine diphosphokinase [Desulfobacterales bacterium]|nr:MAG: 2-amino-4-hydroxy-6-hydroxymethyldihydropteridine diphosphokinase [Desulfobacterales bacterium]
MPGNRSVGNYTVYIGAGSNIGNKLANCQNGIESLIKSGGTVLKDQSRFYKTEPVDYQAQDWFINCVAKIETAKNPFELLHTLKSIERDVGRVADPVKFGPRILDLDILLVDNLVVTSSKLVVPHPRMHKRRFVLQPICDIDAKIIHPVLMKNMQSLLEMLDEDEQRIEEYRCAY